MRLSVVLSLLAALCILPATQSAPEKPYILVVHSYHVGMPWVDGVTQGLNQALSAKAELVVTQLDIKRFPTAGREEAMAITVASKLQVSHARVIIAIDDYAYQLCLRERERLFPGVPIVFGGVNHFDQQRPPGVTGVVEDLDLAPTLELIRALHPEAERLVVLNDATETGQANRAAVEAAMAATTTGLRAVYLGQETFAETEAALTRLDPVRDIVLLLSWNRDTTGAPRSYEEAIAQARRLSPSPIYGVWDFLLGHGIVGGSLLDSKLHGWEVGQLAAQVLAGVPPEAIPIGPHCQSRLVLDERELRRFGISEDRVPKGTEIAFRLYSPWREYRGYIIAVGIVLLAQGATILFLVLARRRQRHAEAQLRKSEQNLAITLSSIGDAMIATDAVGRIVSLNPVAEKLTGWHADDAKGHHFQEVVVLLPNDRPTPSPHPIGEVLRSGQPINLSLPHLLTHRSGSTRLVTANAAPIRNHHPAPIGVVMVLHDITEQRRLEDQLRQSQKIEAIGLLAGGVAHDFNNILQIIRGSLQLARDPESTEKERADFEKQTDEAVNRAADLTRQLLAFGRRQKLEICQVNMGALVSSLLKMVRRLIGENVNVSYVEPETPLWVMADSNQIDQVILNLCINARDAMPDGGTLILELSTATFTDSDSRARPWIRAGDFVVLAVSDTGTGMSPTTLQRIFEPFFTTKGQGHGTGLGLAVVQGVIQQHLGMINVYSEPGHGTTFRVYLPATEKPSDEPHHTAHGHAPLLPAHHRTLLLAEDDSNVRLTTAAQLRRFGYEIIEAADGQTAVDIIRANPRIDAALLDIVMPGLSGWEAARIIQHTHPMLPIVLCSGYSAQLMDSAPLPSHWRYLAKPYPGDALLRMLQEMLADIPPKAPTSAPSAPPS
jgi:two-component system, cell cycle sensor histidine kinase and response regulator CckA